MSRAVSAGWEMKSASAARLTLCRRAVSTKAAAAGFEVRLLEHWDERRVLHQADWDPEEGPIRRSIRFDTKDRGGFRYSSIIVDARKPF